MGKRLAQAFAQKKTSTSGQGGGVGRHTLPPCSTTERITTKPQNK